MLHRSSSPDVGPEGDDSHTSSSVGVDWAVDEAEGEGPDVGQAPSPAATSIAGGIVHFEALDVFMEEAEGEDVDEDVDADVGQGAVAVVIGRAGGRLVVLEGKGGKGKGALVLVLQGQGSAGNWKTPDRSYFSELPTKQKGNLLNQNGNSVNQEGNVFRTRQETL